MHRNFHAVHMKTEHGRYNNSPPRGVPSSAVECYDNDDGEIFTCFHDNNVLILCKCFEINFILMTHLT